MSTEITTLIEPEAVETSPDLVHRVRGLQYFTRHVSRGVEAIGRHDGVPAEVDRSAAARVFLDWVRDLTAQKHMASVNRRDYIVFGAGLLMTRLHHRDVIRVRGAADTAEGRAVTGHPLASVWPEGYLGTVYCLTVLDTVLRQEGLEPIQLQPIASDPRTWESFRENCREDPRRAIPFLDLFVGNVPNWTLPTAAAERPAMRHLS